MSSLCTKEYYRASSRVGLQKLSPSLLTGNIPIIRSPRGNAAEMVSRKLDAKLRDHLASNPSARSGSSSSGLDSLSRPLLVILDRNVDLVPMMSHSWTYQALVHDVLDMKLNRVTVEVSEAMAGEVLLQGGHADMDRLITVSRKWKATKTILRFRFKRLLLGKKRWQSFPSSSGRY